MKEKIVKKDYSEFSEEEKKALLQEVIDAQNNAFKAVKDALDKYNQAHDDVEACEKSSIVGECNLEKLIKEMDDAWDKVVEVRKKLANTINLGEFKEELYRDNDKNDTVVIITDDNTDDNTDTEDINKSTNQAIIFPFIIGIMITLSILILLKALRDLIWNFIVFWIRFFY